MEATAGPADVQVSEIALLPAVHPTIPTAAALLDRQEQGQSESHGRQPACAWHMPLLLFVGVRSLHACILQLHKLVHCCCSRLCRPLSQAVITSAASCW